MDRHPGNAYFPRFIAVYQCDLLFGDYQAITRYCYFLPFWYSIIAYYEGLDDLTEAFEGLFSLDQNSIGRYQERVLFSRVEHPRSSRLAVLEGRDSGERRGKERIPWPSE